MSFSKFIELTTSLGNGIDAYPTASSEAGRCQSPRKAILSIHCFVGVDVEANNDIVGAILEQVSSESMKRLRR